jgi:thioredoxin reductase (NADPH)
MGLSGNDLARRAVAQARRFGVEILTPQEVCGVRVEGPSRVLKLSDGGEVGCRRCSLPRESPSGNSMCRGWKNSAAAACIITRPCPRRFPIGTATSTLSVVRTPQARLPCIFPNLPVTVTMLVRGNSLSDSMSQYLENQIAATKNIEVRLNSSVIAVEGADRCETITIQNNKTRETEKVSASALLIYAGAVPHTDWLAGIVERDAQGYVISGQHLTLEGKRPTGWTADRDPFYLETSVPGIFVAGDVRHRSAKGVTSGVGEGAMAVKLVHQYLGLL